MVELNNAGYVYHTAPKLHQLVKYYAVDYEDMKHQGMVQYVYPSRGLHEMYLLWDMEDVEDLLEMDREPGDYEVDREQYAS